MPKVSVVVAVYNAQQWLPHFFACLQKQTLKDFEVLLVDDCSTDGSVAMIREMSGFDPRFKLLPQPENMGAGPARNRGIMEAAGETLCFADPDDQLPENSLEVRYNAYKKHNAIVRACHGEFTNDGILLNQETRPERFPDICKPVDYVKHSTVGLFFCAHWAWLFPTDLLRRKKIFNGLNMRTAEDIVFLARLFFHIPRMVWIPDTVYYWVKRSDSLSSTVYSAEHYVNYLQCCEVFYEEAAKAGQLRIADMFFNEYLSTYIPNLLNSICDENNDEEDAQDFVIQMARINTIYRVISRNIENIQKNIMGNVGLFQLWDVLQSKDPSAITRLVQAHTRFKELKNNNN
ncbi:glycosyltransferase family 2 protein [Maridesulfovibrio sp.]|uniref:glycosyltransferase family 2 protein n=1 Tax=Maridesulfovibrio sp. TaxID=2795000 RepID=UPI0029F5C879|nr:glycosyltransferase family 2 protein [Maridesulfovibrio sp.]